MEFFKILYGSFILIFSFDYDLFEIIILSLKSSGLATLMASVFGIFTGYFLSISETKLSNFTHIILSSLTGIPPVVAGLIVYFIFSKDGPLGVFSIIYTPYAIVIAQIVIVFPIISSLTKVLFDDFRFHYNDSLKTYNFAWNAIMYLFIRNNRILLVSIFLNGFGRAISEVGAVMIVGGNIEHYTRVMTSAITLETSMGNLQKAMSLGIILILITMSINIFSFKLNKSI